jgi:hypothetical protein
MLPLIDMALQDSDRDTRHYAIGVLQRITAEAMQARSIGRSPVTDPGLFPPLHQTVLRLIDYPDTLLRAGIVDALPAFAAASADPIDTLLVNRLAAEVPYVRAHVVAALAARADRGSAEARAGVLASLNDPNLGVRVSAIKAMRTVRALEAIPALLEVVESSEVSDVRQMAVQVLGYYGSSVTPYATRISADIAGESSAAVKTELERLAASLGQARATP